jgi:hypothetical protein
MKIIGNVDTSADTGSISDGYHTFDELYNHRNLLFLAFLNYHGGWKAEKHYDGTSFDGYFIAGCELEGMQISYHLPKKFWYLSNEKVESYEVAPVDFDGYTSDDVVTRLLLWLMKQTE